MFYGKAWLGKTKSKFNLSDNLLSGNILKGHLLFSPKKIISLFSPLRTDASENGWAKVLLSLGEVSSEICTTKISSCSLAFECGSPWVCCCPSEGEVLEDLLDLLWTLSSAAFRIRCWWSPALRSIGSLTPKSIFLEGENCYSGPYDHTTTTVASS